MLKQTITYTDFNDKEVTESLYFNITKSELSDHLEMKETLEKMQQQLGGPSRELSTKEIQQILDLVKFFIEISYGIRSEDGRRFKKGPEVLQEFKETAAYDAFLFSLFEDPNKAVDFLIKVMPKDLQDAVSKVKDHLPEPVTDGGEMTVQQPIDQVDGEQPKRQYTQEELSQMTPAQLQEILNG